MTRITRWMVLASVITPSVHAQELTSTAELEALLEEQVVSTASRSAERAGTAPASVFTITGTELRTFGIRSVEEALAYLGVGMPVVRARDYGSGGEVGAQGMTLHDGGRRVLVLVDGEVMNTQDTGMSQLSEGLGVPLDAIDHIEVVLGAGSVSYGSNAMLAVIQVFTRGAAREGESVTIEAGLATSQDVDGRPTWPGTGERWGLRLRIGASTARHLHMFGSEGEAVVRAEWWEDTGSTLAVPPLAESETSQLRPGESTWGGLARIPVRAPSASVVLRVGDFRLAIQGNVFEQGMPFVGAFAEPSAADRRAAARVSLQHATLLDARVQLRSQAYAGLNRRSETSRWTSPFWCPDGQAEGCDFAITSSGRWAGLEQQLAVDWDLDGRVVTTVGYDVRGRDMTSRPADYFDHLTGEAPTSVRLPARQRVSALGAVFAQQVWTPFDALSFNVGARLDVDTLAVARLSPRVAATVSPIEGMTVRASYAEAFRAPSAYELTEVDPTYRVQPESLGAEVVRAADLEVRQQVGSTSVHVRGFIQFFDGVIDTRMATDAEIDAARARGEVAADADPANFIAWTNFSQMRTLGVSGTFAVRPISALSLAGSLTFAETVRDGATLALAPTWMGNLRATYAFDDDSSLAIAATFLGPRVAYADYTDAVSTDAPPSLGVRATLATDVPALEGLHARFILDAQPLPGQGVLLEGPRSTSPLTAAVFQPTMAVLSGYVTLQWDFEL